MTEQPLDNLSVRNPQTAEYLDRLINSLESAFRREQLGNRG